MRWRSICLNHPCIICNYFFRTFTSSVKNSIQVHQVFPTHCLNWYHPKSWQAGSADPCSWCGDRLLYVIQPWQAAHRKAAVPGREILRPSTHVLGPHTGPEHLYTRTTQLASYLTNVSRWFRPIVCGTIWRRKAVLAVMVSSAKGTTIRMLPDN